MSDFRQLVGKQAVFNRPGRPLTIETNEIPPPPPGGMIVKVALAGVCGSDWHILDGHIPSLDYPTAIGHEGVGVVAALADGVTTDAAGRSIAIGDRVFWSPYARCGCCHACTTHQDAYPCEQRIWPPRADEPSPASFQQYATLNAENEVYRIADDTPSEAVIAFGCAMVAAFGGFDRLGEIRAGQTVVVQGSGPVGLAVTMLAALSQAHQIIMIGDPPSRLDAARMLGATTILPLGETTVESRGQTIRDLTDSRGADVVIEASGNIKAFEEGINLLTFNGRYLVIGLWAGSGTVPIDPFRLNNLSIKIIGSLGVTRGTHLRVLRLVEAHHERFKLASLITHRYSLAEAEKGINAARMAESIKVVLTPNA